jgi:hypothetical protein
MIRNIFIDLRKSLSSRMAKEEGRVAGTLK